MKTQIRKGRKSYSPVAATNRNNDRQVGQIARRILEIEALEARLLLSGVGTGLNKKKVTFTDADGDKVTVTLKGGAKAAHPSFDIVLDGSAADHADIQSIILHGDANTNLSIVVTPSKLKLPNIIPGITHGKPYTFTPGFTEISSISSNSSFGGISANSAAIDSVVFSDPTAGVANLGSIAIDIPKTQFFGLPTDPLAKVDLGSVSVEGHIGSIVLHGRADFSNDIVGIISAGAGIDNINAPSSDLLAPINITGAPTTGSNAGVALGRLSVHDVLANVTATGNIGTVQANNLLASISSTGNFANLVLQGNLTGLVQANAFQNASVNGNWTGTLKANSVGDLIINGSSFTGTIQALAGNIGNVTVAQSGVAFGAHLLATGNIGDLSAGTFDEATIQAGGSIGNVTAVDAINGTSLIAGGAIGNITVIAGNFGGSMGWAQFLQTAVGDLSLTGPLTLHIVGPAANFVEGASIGNITAHGDISGNVITATAGNIGNLTAQTGRIAFDTVRSEGNIGNITAHAEHASVAFDSAGNLILGSVYDNVYNNFTVSASAIQGDLFAAKGTIGNINALAPNVGGYVTVSVSASGIDDSVFTAGQGIGTITAHASGIINAEYAGGDPDFNAGIRHSTFTVTGTGLTGQVIGDVNASGVGGDGIDYVTFHAVSGDIGNITGTSTFGDGIEGTHILATTGNVGVVTGVSLGGAGLYGENGMDSVTIQAGDGVGGTGRIAGIVGHAVYGHGLSHVYAYAGTGGIGDITGTSTGAYNMPTFTQTSNGINEGYFSTTGSIGNITGSSASNDGIHEAGFYADGNIGNILGQATGHSSNSGIYDSWFHADFANKGTGSIGSITGTSVGFGSGIDDGTFEASSGIGAIKGTSTGAYGDHGITDSYFNADYTHSGKGAIASVTGISSDWNGIDDSDFIAGAGIGPVYGAALGPWAGNGIDSSTFNADIDHNGVGAIASVTGITKANGTNSSGTATFGVAGISGSKFFAGDSIGDVKGASYGNGDSAGITGSSFYANAGPSATTGGTGSIGTITGISTSAQATGWHQGIEDSYFGAGNGLHGTGTIGDVNATASVVSQSGGAQATGIWNTTFAAGTAVDGTGTIGSITAAASAIDNAGNGATARGINDVTIQAGGLSGTIGTVTANAVAASANADADARGLKGVTITAGGSPNSVGSIGAVAAYGKAVGVDAHAFGIVDSTITAAYVPGGNGTITSINGAANATGTDFAFASGIEDTSIYSGMMLGSLGSLTGTGTATSTGATAVAFGINDTSVYVGTGTGLNSGVGNITGDITGTATATAANNAVAHGIDHSTVTAGYAGGSIANIIGTATASTNGTENSTAIARADGIDHSDFYAGYDASGTIGNVTGTATATANGEYVTAHATGIKDTGLFAGAYRNNMSGSIGTITGTATATASGFSANARAIGINDLTAEASTGQYGTGSIANVIGRATATATASGPQTAQAVATGILDSYIAAGTGFHGTGSIGDVKGYAYTTANSQGLGTSEAYSYGISSTKIYSGSADTGSGTVGSVYGIVSATANGGNAYTKAYGFNGPTIKVGGTSGVLPFIHEVISAYANSPSGYASARTGGLNGLTVIAGFGPYGTGSIGVNPATGDSVYGKATATAIGFTGAYASASGVDNFKAILGGGYKGNGSMGNVTGIGIATATSTGYKSSASAFANGILNSSFEVANASDYGYSPKSFGGTGSIGNITGTATATATANKDESSAKAKAVGISGTYAGAGNAYSDGYGNVIAYAGNGSIGNVTGTGTATATATGFAGKAYYATGIGISGTTLRAGNATAYMYFYGTSTAKAGTGSIGNITGTGSGTATGVSVGNAYATGMIDVTAQAGTANASIYGGTATAANGTIGDITGTATATANASPVFGTSAATASGITDLDVSAATAHAETAKGAVGIIGDISGSGIANATAATATSAAYGIDPSTVDAGSSTVSSPYVDDTSTAGAGTIGDVSGYALANATGLNATGLAYGILNLSLGAGNAATSIIGDTATAAAGTIGSITGTAITNVIASGSTAAVSGRAYGITDLYANAGNATATGGGASVATGAAGIVGDISGAATANVTGTTSGGDVYGVAIGVSFVSVNAGNASAATATAGSGSIGSLTGSGAVNVNGTTSGNGHDVTGRAVGITGYVGLSAGNATAGKAAGDTAQAGAATLGNIAGTASVTVVGNTNGTYADVFGSATGVGSLGVYAANATGDAATAAATVMGNLTGTAAVTITGTTIGTDSYVSATATGLGSLSVEAGNASASGAKATATGGSSTIGTLTGTANVIVNGTTTGAGADVVAYGVIGIDDPSFSLGNASGYVAKAGSASVAATGAIAGSATVSVTGNTKGDNADVGASYVYGLDSITITAGQATGGAGKGASATGGATTVGAISGTSTITVTGITTGANSTVFDDAQGIGGDYGYSALTLGNATGYTAVGGAATIGAITGAVTSKVTGTTSGYKASIDVQDDIAGFDAFTITASSATASGAKAAATAGSLSVGAITGTASVTVTGITTGDKAGVVAGARGFEDGPVIVGGSATGYIATAGALTVGAITGTGTATVTATTSGKSLTVSGYGDGIGTGPTIIGGAATGYKAYGGTSNIGAIVGTGTATVAATTGGGKSIAVSAASSGVNGLFISVSQATGSNAKAGVATAGETNIGTITGAATSSATNTSTYKGAGSTVYAEAHGLSNSKIYAGDASAYTATSGNVTIGMITGTGKATASGAYGKQVVGANATGIRNLYCNPSHVTIPVGGKASGGVVNIGGLTGTAGAYATGYFASANAKGIDPSYGGGGGGTGVSTSGVNWGPITGTAIANATGNAKGVGSTAIAGAYGIYGLTIQAGAGAKAAGTIGAITGYGKATSSAPLGKSSATAYGIGAVGVGACYFYAGGTGGSGSISSITGKAYADDGATAAKAFGIRNVTAYSATSIGNITGAALKSTLIGGAIVEQGYGIFGSKFVANTGTLGNIKGTASVDTVVATPIFSYGIKNSTFAAGGNIGSITTDHGGIFGSQFLGGIGLSGATLVRDAATTYTAGAIVGSVSTQGFFLNSDVIASVKAPAVGAAFGGIAGVDTNVGVGGSIGTITIGLGTFVADGNTSHAIEAANIGDLNGGLAGIQISVGGAQFTLPGIISNFGSNVRVRTI